MQCPSHSIKECNKVSNASAYCSGSARGTAAVHDDHSSHSGQRYLLFPEWIITVGHRTFAVQILYMTDRYAVSLTTRPVKHRGCYAKLRLGPGPYRARGVGWIGYATLTTCCSDMATKRSASTSVSASQAPLKKTKRQVTVLTFRKWQTNYEQEHQALSWLCCDVDEGDKSLVGLLWCSVCRRFEERIRGVKNFSNVWITGSTNHKSSNVLDHARSEQHKAAMGRLRVEQATAAKAPVTTYAPIARSLLTIDKTVQDKVKKKFDICFVMAKENMAFHFFSFMMDGTTDAGNIEDELIVILYCKKDDATEEIKSCARYYT